MKYIRSFEQIGIKDIALVGGKTASLGEMIQILQPKGIQIPGGFAVTAPAYWHYITSNKLQDTITQLLEPITKDVTIDELSKVGKKIRELIVSGHMPDDLADEISTAYQELNDRNHQKNMAVAVRSSATAEDLPDASFAGQQETFLHVSGAKELLQRCKECFASLFTDRAILYREEKGFAHMEVALSVAVQQMVRSDEGSSGVAFSLDTETGFPGVVLINSSYGLGEAIVQGKVVPDEFLVHKPTLKKGFAPIIKKTCGSKELKIVYADQGNKLVKEVPVPQEKQHHFSLSDDDILEIARAVVLIEDHYSQLKGKWTPMDVEWAKDGTDGKIYILQARPETIYGAKSNQMSLTQYTLQADDTTQLKTVVVGQSIGQQIVSGRAKVVDSVEDIHTVQKGDIIVTRMTDPDWVPAMKKAVGIITEQGGRTCHAAIVSRELGIPAMVGACNAMQSISDGQEITMDCSQGKVGYVYQGTIPFSKETIVLNTLPSSPVKLMINLADPDRAFRFAHYPLDGVGLARIEFIINNAIKIHPMALLYPDKVTDEHERKQIDRIAKPYATHAEFYVDTLAQGIASIAASVYPKPVIVRFSDFKTNEYRNLIGGSYFEPQEENPMIGFRGARRYYDARFKDAFDLECQAIKKVRDTMGFTNVQVMVPFVRTIGEAEKVITEMKHQGLERGVNDLKIIMMCEIPSNVLLIDDFLRLFDGISIGSNDLTQLILGVDRDSGLLGEMFDERNPAVKAMLNQAVQGAKRNKKYSGICGQAPSDYPEIADYLIDAGIDSISLNPDSVIPFLLRYKQ